MGFLGFAPFEVVGFKFRGRGGGGVGGGGALAGVSSR